MVFAVNARFFSQAAAVALPLFSIVACGDDDDGASPGPDAGTSGDASAPVCAETPAPEKPSASCEVTIESPPISGNQHLSEGTQITYCSNPPSSGPHYPVWAAFQEYSAPVEWPYLVHSLEHGAIVLLYKCEQACPEIVDQLKAVRDNAAADPLCAAYGGGKRIIIAPSTTIATPVAAAAWGKTYQAACVDMPTLEAFARDNYAKGPEDLCIAGRTF